LTKWNKDLIAYRLSRADETLKDARILAKSDRWDSSVNRLYYACFYAVSALLMVNGLSSSKHSGIRSLFNKHFVKSEKVPKKLAAIYNDLLERRQEVDYIDFINFREEQVMPWISKAEEFINFISGLIKDSQ